jgi:hypothetical protein
MHRFCLPLPALIARGLTLLYDRKMGNDGTIVCDGCGQVATPEHIARRLKRLEKMTRYRPIHVQVLFLGAVSPAEEEEYLYSAPDESAQEAGAEGGSVQHNSKSGALLGEGAQLLQALGMESVGRSAEAMLAEFQRRGFLLAHVLECPGERGASAVPIEALRTRFPATIARIRRSFKPRRVVLLGADLADMVPELVAAKLDAPLVLRNGYPFEWNEIRPGELGKELTAAVQAL